MGKELAVAQMEGTLESPSGQFGPWLKAEVDQNYEKNKKPFGPSLSNSTETSAGVKHNSLVASSITVAADQVPMVLGGNPKSSSAILSEKQSSFAAQTVVEPNGEGVTESNLQEVSAGANSYMLTKEAMDSRVVGLGCEQKEMTSPLENPRPNYVTTENYPTMECGP